MSLKISVGDVKCRKPGNHAKCTAAKTGERVDDLFKLLTEQNAHQNETTPMQHRAHSIEENESSSVHARVTGEWRGQGAQAGYELRHNNASHAVSCEKILRCQRQLSFTVVNSNCRPRDFACGERKNPAPTRSGKGDLRPCSRNSALDKTKLNPPAMSQNWQR